RQGAEVVVALTAPEIAVGAGHVSDLMLVRPSPAKDVAVVSSSARAGAPDRNLDGLSPERRRDGGPGYGPHLLRIGCKLPILVVPPACDVCLRRESARRE